MNYERIYELLISHAKLTNIHKQSYEKHHIIPKSLGGRDDKSNMVNFTPRQHFIAHKLLMKWTNTIQMKQAWFFMTNLNENVRIKKSKLYETIRLELAEESRRRNSGRQCKTKGMTNINNPKEIHQYSIEGHYIQTFPSRAEVSRILNIKTQALPRSCKTNCITGGFQWRDYKVDKIPSIKTAKERISIAHKNIQKTAEWNKKNSEANKGRKFTQEHCDNLKRSLQNSDNLHRKAVCQYTLDNVFIKEYRSAREAGIDLGIDNSSIGSCCKLQSIGKKCTVKGFIFKYSTPSKEGMN